MSPTSLWQLLHHTPASNNHTLAEEPTWYWLPGWSFTPNIFECWYLHLPGKHFGLDYRHLPNHHQCHKSHPEKPSFADTVQYLIEQSQPNAHWVGWSLGGALAASAAAPSHATSLTTLATGSPFCQRADQDWGMPPATLAAFIAGFRTRPAKIQQRFIGLCSQGSSSPKSLMRTLSSYQCGTEPETKYNLLTILNWLTDYEIPKSDTHILAQHFYASADAINPGGLKPAKHLSGSHAFWLEAHNHQQLLEHLTTIIDPGDHR